MRVKAKSMGFYGGNRIRPGKEFTLSDPKHFSEKWMDKVGGDAGKPAPKGGEPKPAAKPAGEAAPAGKSPKAPKGSTAEGGDKTAPASDAASKTAS